VELPLVTIVIPTLNEEKYIGRCLRSIHLLAYPKEKLEIIVVDNISTDKTIDIATEIGADVIRVKPISIAHSRNTGAKKAKGEILAFIDADCLVTVNWLARGVEYFKDPRIVAVGSYPAVLEQESNQLQKAWSILCRGNESEVRKSEWLSSANLIVRKGSFNQIGGFNDSLITCEDSDLGYRLGKLGDIINDPQVLVFHLREPRTWMAFFKKEVWHSRGNLAGVFSHGINLKEFPSFLMPLTYGLGVFGLLLIPFYGLKIMLACLWLIGGPVILYAGRGFHLYRNFNYLVRIYFVYLAARSFSLYKDIMLFFRKLVK
jgi:glycosyltransferase involved in cell wall biosynthesis